MADQGTILSNEIGAAAAIAMTLCYLAGAVPFGLILTRLFVDKDVRTAGSGNIGATNVARVAGKKIGVATLLLDTCKGLGPVVIGSGLGADGVVLGGMALAAVVGHCFPVYLRFKGGKGVATGLGVFVALSPTAAVIGAACYVVAFALTKISALGSFSLLLANIAANAWLAPPWWPLWVVLAVSCVIVIRHGENIKRLVAGNENRF